MREEDKSISYAFSRRTDAIDFVIESNVPDAFITCVGSEIEVVLIEHNFYLETENENERNGNEMVPLDLPTACFELTAVEQPILCVHSEERLRKYVRLSTPVDQGYVTIWFILDTGSHNSKIRDYTIRILTDYFRKNTEVYTTRKTMYKLEVNHNIHLYFEKSGRHFSQFDILGLDFLDLFMLIMGKSTNTFLLLPIGDTLHRESLKTIVN